MRKNDSVRQELLQIYHLLREHFGFLNWWPGQTPFEVMVGAILTQNTAWSNVEKAIQALKAANALSPQAIDQMPLSQLKQLIRPSGYFNQKAEKLKAFTSFFLSPPWRGSIQRLAKEETMSLRGKLLGVRGIGPETADSILLYALNKPVFVVDAYTRRIFYRLGFLPADADYDATQKFFTSHLPCDLTLYNDFHAQIVYLGKEFCRKQPRCEPCPLRVLNRCQDMVSTLPKKSSPLQRRPRKVRARKP